MAFRDIELDDFVKVRRPSQPKIHGVFGDVIEIGSCYFRVRLFNGEEDWFGNDELMIADRSIINRYVHEETVEIHHDDEYDYRDPEGMDYDVLVDHVYELRSEIARLKSELQRF